MASRRKSRGRKAPRRKRNRYLVHGRWIDVKYVDGYRLRHPQPDDIDIMFWRGDGSRNNQALERDTLFIEKSYRAETEFFVKIYEIETMRKWTKRGDNNRFPPYLKQREYLKRQLCAPYPAVEADFVVRKEWNAEHQVNIWYVRGDMVRKSFDPHFAMGGHDLVYPKYIKEPYTIWIDACQDEREIPYTIVHEIAERKKMALGWSYAKAHAYAIQRELALRFREYIVEPDKEDLMSQLKPLKVVPIEQSDTGCGPTSMKMLLDYDRLQKEDGTPYSEDDLIALCGCDPETGTDHAPLLEGMRKIAGDRVVCGENATLDDLKRIVLGERRPVMIGWWVDDHQPEEAVQADNELDGGHYSVVTHVNAQRIWIADPWIIDPEADEEDENDPGGAPGIRKLRHQEFLERWYDMDGSPTESDPGYHTVRGWYAYLRAPEAGEPKP